MSMTEESPGTGTAPAAGRKGSSRAGFGRGALGGVPPATAALFAVGLAAAAMMIAAEFTTLRSVQVLTASCADLADPDLRSACVTKGGEEHSYALVVLGIFAAVMAWGAFLGRSRPAAFALAVVGIAVLAIALVTDVPDAGATGVLGERFEEANAEPGPALWLEIAGGGLAVALGAVALARSGGIGRRPGGAERAGGEAER